MAATMRDRKNLPERTSPPAAATRSAARRDAGASRLRLVVRTDGGATLLPLHEVHCVEAAGNVVLVHAADGETYRLRESLTALFAQLRPHGFVRVHRGTVVRADAIVAVEKGRYRKAYCVLASGGRFEIGRLEFHRLRPLWQAGLLDLDALSASLQLVAEED